MNVGLFFFFFSIRQPDKAPSQNVEAFLHASSLFSGWAGVQPCSGSWEVSPAGAPDQVKKEGGCFKYST